MINWFQGTKYELLEAGHTVELQIKDLGSYRQYMTPMAILSLRRLTSSEV